MIKLHGLEGAAHYACVLGPMRLAFYQEDVFRYRMPVWCFFKSFTSRSPG